MPENKKCFLSDQSLCCTELYRDPKTYEKTDDLLKFAKQLHDFGIRLQIGTDIFTDQVMCTFKCAFDKIVDTCKHLTIMVSPKSPEACELNNILTSFLKQTFTNLIRIIKFEYNMHKSVFVIDLFKKATDIANTLSLSEQREILNLVMANFTTMLEITKDRDFIMNGKMNYLCLLSIIDFYNEAEIIYKRLGTTIDKKVVSRIMRKLVCSLFRNEVSPQ